jgi:hypothetical protein
VPLLAIVPQPAFASPDNPSHPSPDLKSVPLAIAAIQKWVKQNGIDGYTGMSVDSQTGRLHLYVANSSSGRMSQLPTLTTPYGLTIHYVP